ncbi:MAG: hypothetical protein ACM31L_10595 [Actinomycetota bacterium]
MPLLAPLLLALWLAGCASPRVSIGDTVAQSPAPEFDQPVTDDPFYDGGVFDPAPFAVDRLRPR